MKGNFSCICLLLPAGEKDRRDYICRSCCNPGRSVRKLYRALRDRELYLNGYGCPPLLSPAGFCSNLCTELPVVYTDL